MLPGDCRLIQTRGNNLRVVTQQPKRNVAVARGDMSGGNGMLVITIRHYLVTISSLSRKDGGAYLAGGGVNGHYLCSGGR